MESSSPRPGRQGKSRYTGGNGWRTAEQGTPADRIHVQDSSRAGDSTQTHSLFGGNRRRSWLPWRREIHPPIAAGAASMSANPPQELPLFPLGTVLFPAAPLPLHIFEERYKRMMADRIDHDPIFGVVLTRIGSEVGDEPSTYSVGTSASTVESQSRGPTAVSIWRSSGGGDSKSCRETGAGDI